MQEELDSLIKVLNIDNKKEIKCLNSKIYFSSYLGTNIIMGLCGIGKVNAAIFTQHIIDKYNIDHIFNVGVAGTLNDKVILGDVVVATDLVYHDFDVREFNYELGQVPRIDIFSFSTDLDVLNKTKSFNDLNFKIYYGRVVTGDQFIADIEKAIFIRDYFGSLACEMEATAIAHTAYLNNIKFTIIKGLSDMAGLDNKAVVSFEKFLETASINSSIVIKNILDCFF